MAKRPASSNKEEFRKPKSKYRPEEFIIPAKDARGESVRFSFRIQPAHDRQMSVILNSRAFPFQTPGDIARWALHRGIKQLEVMEPIPSVTQQVEAMLAMLRDDEFHQQFSDFLLHAQRVIQRHYNEGAHGEARRLVAGLRAKVMDMPEGFWRDKYLRAIKQQFSHVLANKDARVQQHVFGDESDDEE